MRVGWRSKLFNERKVSGKKLEIDLEDLVLVGGV